MEKLTKLKVIPFAKFQAFLLFLFGLLCGAVYSFGGLIIDAMVSFGWLSPSSMSTTGLGYGTLLAFGALLGMPLAAGIGGFILGIFEALLFNLFTRCLGGITMDFQ